MRRFRTMFADDSKLIPMFNLDMRLRELSMKECEYVMHNHATLFQCNVMTFYKIRFCAKDGTYSPSFRTIRLIAEYFGITIDSLYNRNDTPLPMTYNRAKKKVQNSAPLFNEQKNNI